MSHFSFTSNIIHVYHNCSRNKCFTDRNVCYNGCNTSYGKDKVVTKKSSPRKMSVYANLSHKRKTKKDHKARKRAEYLATLPKHPVKRTLYRMHPKRVAKYWFSRKGGIMALKIIILPKKSLAEDIAKLLGNNLN